MGIKALIMVCFVLTIAYNINAQPVKTHGQLKVEGTKLLDKDGNIAILRGVSFGWHNWWPRFWNGDAVKWLAEDWKCDVLRAAMGVEPDSGYIKQPEWSQKLMKNVVEAAIKNDIYVIIDWHSHHTRLDEAKKFFGSIAKTYGAYPNIIYEIYNEPVNQSWKEIKEYSIEVIKEIRKYDPDNIILVGSPHWDQDVDIVANDPITGFDNLMYTLHFYAATHKKKLRNSADEAIKRGLPIFVSEYGACKASGNGAIDYNELNLWMEWMDKNEISWCKWSIADKDETCSMLKPDAASNGNWKESQLKESGILTKKLLEKYNKKKQ